MERELVQSKYEVMCSGKSYNKHQGACDEERGRREARSKEVRTKFQGIARNTGKKGRIISGLQSDVAATKAEEVRRQARAVEDIF